MHAAPWVEKPHTRLTAPHAHVYISPADVHHHRRAQPRHVMPSPPVALCVQFKDVLTHRTDSLKHHRERRSLFTSNADPEAGMPLLARHRAAAANGSQGGSHPAAPSFLAGPTPQQQQQQLVLANPQDTYMSSRAAALRNVENTIVELGGIFNKLSELVAEQGELAIRIDENVEDTLHNVNSAQQQLLKYLHGLQNNRWLVLKVMGVLMVFLLLFVFFIA